MRNTQRCEICGTNTRTIHHENNKHWCWNCEPYRPGSAIQAIKHNRFERTMARAPVEFLKAMIFVAIGYGWAVAAYGIFPIR